MYKQIRKITSKITSKNRLIQKENVDNDCEKRAYTSVVAKKI